jgi:hypothetical protein
MDKSEIIERLKNIASHAVHTVGERPFVMSLDDGIAVHEAIELLTNYPEIPDSWVPCSKKMPEEHEWIGTRKFGTTISDEVYVTFENPKGERFTKHLSFQNGKVPNFEQRTIDAFYKGSVPIAWMPLPEPWKGEQNGQTD